MKKEAALIVGVIMAALAVAGVVLTPEQAELLESVIMLVVTLGGAGLIRQFVASRKTVENVAGKDTAARVFDGKAKKFERKIPRDY